jgi:AcrR family transcriptional regulator
MAAAAHTLIARALDPDVAPPGDAMSERILDAALALVAESGIRHLTMDDVASRAGVGRMTVYRRFGDRDTLVEALYVRECRACLARLAGVVDLGKPVEERVADGFVAALAIAREHPLVNRMARLEPGTALAGINADGGLLFGLMRAFVTQQIREGERLGDMDVDDAEAAAEVIVRLGLSFVLIPQSVVDLDDEVAARDLARTMIAPIVSRRSG